MSLDQIVVFEPDAKYTYASAPRSAGGLRQQVSRHRRNAILLDACGLQFSLPVNVELSLYGVDFLKRGLERLCEGLSEASFLRSCKLFLP